MNRRTFMAQTTQAAPLPLAIMGSKSGKAASLVRAYRRTRPASDRAFLAYHEAFGAAEGLLPVGEADADPNVRALDAARARASEAYDEARDALIAHVLKRHGKPTVNPE